MGRQGIVSYVVESAKARHGIASEVVEAEISPPDTVAK
jgi:hypothetical protein